MADVLALDDINDVFGDVGGVVANAFEIFGYQDQFKGGEDYAGVAHHVGEQLAEDLVAEVVALVVHGEDFLGQLDVAANHGVQGVANHFFGDFAHARQIDVGLYARVAKDPDRSLRYVDGLIADALEVVVDAGYGEDEAQVHGHQLVQGEELNYAVLDFDLQFIDGVFLVEDALGLLLVGVEDGVNGLVNGTFGQTAHPEEAFL